MIKVNKEKEAEEMDHSTDHGKIYIPDGNTRRG